MSFASMPLFTGDYLRDTRHLTPLRHGIYLLALMHCWDSKGPMPLDEQEAAGICNCRSADEIEALRYIMDRFFIRMDDGHYNKRMADEVAKFERLSKRFSAAGLRSAEVRREKARAGAREKMETRSSNIEGRLSLGLTQAEPRSVSPTPTPTLSLIQKYQEESSPRASAKPAVPSLLGTDENLKAIDRKSLVAIDSAFELPSAWGADAERLGWRPSAILKESEKFRQYWTVGKGSGTRRTLKGWRQSWSNWLSKAERFA